MMVVDQLRDYLEHGNIVNAVNFPDVLMARESAFRVGIANANVPNMVGQISTAMASAGLNIHNMVNKSSGEMAYTLVDVDSAVSPQVVGELSGIEGVLMAPLSSRVSAAGVTDEIRTLRGRIDAVDDQLLALVNERAELARRIGTLKGDGPVYRPEREAQVLRRVMAGNPGPLPADAVVRLFTEVMSACRSLEESMAVAFLGPRGTFSEEAAVKRFGGSVQGVPCASIDEVFRQVEARQASFGVVPVENSTDGAVGRTLDLLLATAAKVCGEVLLPRASMPDEPGQ